MKSALCHLLLLLTLVVANFASAKEKLPNFIVILADDLGYGDLSGYGHPTIHTPCLDRMAGEGMRFTDFYVAASVCTPSRAALLTGRLPIRTGMAGGHTNHVLNAKSTGGLPPEEITIATALKTKNYATACVGKWHLGHLPLFLPTRHGFDSFFGLRWSNDMEPMPKIPKGASMQPAPKEEWWACALLRDHQIIEQPVAESTLTRRYTEEAVQFIRKNRKQPFFLYFPHTFPHVPLFASEKFKGKSLRGTYGDVVEELDWSVGQILETLRKEKLAENTLVFFLSDNGPWLVKDLAGGSSGLLRGGKGSTWEGGLRVPGIAWWPGKIKAGSVNRELASSLDLFNTILALAEVPIPADRIMDGVTLSPLLFGTGPSQRDVMFYYYGAELFAVRKGVFKAHFITHDGYSKEPFTQHELPLLFNLAHDPSERLDIAKNHPEVLAEIQREVTKHRANLLPGRPQY